MVYMRKGKEETYVQGSLQYMGQSFYLWIYSNIYASFFLSINLIISVSIFVFIHWYFYSYAYFYPINCKQKMQGLGPVHKQLSDFCTNLKSSDRTKIVVVVYSDLMFAIMKKFFFKPHNKYSSLPYFFNEVLTLTPLNRKFNTLFDEVPVHDVLGLDKGSDCSDSVQLISSVFQR